MSSLSFRFVCAFANLTLNHYVFLVFSYDIQAVAQLQPPHTLPSSTASITLSPWCQLTTSATLPTPSPPPPRQMLYTSHQQPVTGSPFKVMCYNVLADIYATRQIYSYTPAWALQWDFRTFRCFAFCVLRFAFCVLRVACSCSCVKLLVCEVLSCCLCS
jgi:hypothetical protein